MSRNRRNGHTRTRVGGTGHRTRILLLRRRSSNRSTHRRFIVNRAQGHRRSHRVQGHIGHRKRTGSQWKLAKIHIDINGIRIILTGHNKIEMSLEHQSLEKQKGASIGDLGNFSRPKPSLGQRLLVRRSEELNPMPYTDCSALVCIVLF